MSAVRCKCLTEVCCVDRTVVGHRRFCLTSSARGALNGTSVVWRQPSRSKRPKQLFKKWSLDHSGNHIWNGLARVWLLATSTPLRRFFRYDFLRYSSAVLKHC
eukprot:COSAG05_NODE_35_length_27765_cov_221.324719_6_plen_103_part_00